MNSTFQRLMRAAARLAQAARQSGQPRQSGQSGQSGQPGGLPALSLPEALQGHPASASFQQSMAEAARLTQSGDLQAATAAIQAALSGTAAAVPAAFAVPTAFDMRDVIDVQAHEVRREAWPQEPPAAAAPESAPAPASNAAAGAAAPVPPLNPGPAGQFISGSHTDASAGMREYKLYIPPGAASGQPLPLVVMLHGCTQNPDDFAAGTGMNEAARQRGFYVLYPAQTQHANASRCWNWFKHNHQKRGRGEPALLAGMTRAVMAHHAIDPQRVYVAGLSAGGAMAAILGDAYPELFAAVGVHSGLASGAAGNLQEALGAMKSGGAHRARAVASPPTIVFHGDEDAVVHPANGEHVVAASAGALPSEHQRGRSRNGREYSQRRYRQADGRVVAEHWVVHGAGHAWSGGSAQGSYTDAQGPDATEEMLRFFLEKRLP